MIKKLTYLVSCLLVTFLLCLTHAVSAQASEEGGEFTSLELGDDSVQPDDVLLGGGDDSLNEKDSTDEDAILPKEDNLIDPTDLSHK